MKNSFLILVLVSAMACSGDKQSKLPANLIAEDTMVNILIDIHVAQADVSMRNLPQDSADNLFLIKKTKILQSYNADEARFKDSYFYYLDHISQLEDMYARVVDSIGLKETQANIN